MKTITKSCLGLKSCTLQYTLDDSNLTGKKALQVYNELIDTGFNLGKIVFGEYDRISFSSNKLKFEDVDPEKLESFKDQELGYIKMDRSIGYFCEYRTVRISKTEENKYNISIFCKENPNSIWVGKPKNPRESALGIKETIDNIICNKLGDMKNGMVR